MKRIAIVKWTSIDISIISLSLMEMLASITIISQLPYFSISIILILALVLGMLSISDIDKQLRSGFYLRMGHKNTLGCYLFECYLTGIF